MISAEVGMLLLNVLDIDEIPVVCAFVCYNVTSSLIGQISEELFDIVCSIGLSVSCFYL